MTKTAWIALGVLFAPGVCSSASSAPEAEITNGLIRARLYLPDAHAGFYRGTRFDWSGVIGGLNSRDTIITRNGFSAAMQVSTTLSMMGLTLSRVPARR